MPVPVQGRYAPFEFPLAGAVPPRWGKESGVILEWSYIPPAPVTDTRPTQGEDAAGRGFSLLRNRAVRYWFIGAARGAQGII